MLVQQGSDIERPPDVPASHDVGESVVVNMFVILVRSDDSAYVEVPVRLPLSATGPEPARLEEDFCTGIEEESFVAGCLPVLPDRIGDVCGDVLLLLAAEHIDDMTIRTDNLLRG